MSFPSAMLLLLVDFDRRMRGYRNDPYSSKYFGNIDDKSNTQDVSRPNNSSGMYEFDNISDLFINFLLFNWFSRKVLYLCCFDMESYVETNDLVPYISICRKLFLIFKGSHQEEIKQK